MAVINQKTMELTMYFNRCLSVFHVRKKSELMYSRFLRFINEAHRDGVMGDARYAVALSKARKLERFLRINGQSSMPVRAFTNEMVLKYRQFIQNEYQYVSLYPGLYPRGSGHRPPQKRLRDTTVVHDLKLLQAFFAELENTGEIDRSPFRRISLEKRRHMMHVMYDAPIFLRAEEIKQVMATPVPAELQRAKDIFVLNCAIGCRISDFLRLSLDKVAVSEEGIPFVHYIPSKTSKMQTTNLEVMTPLIEPALEIVLRTRLELFGQRGDRRSVGGRDGRNLKYQKQVYNQTLRRLLAYCGINRLVCLYDPERDDNVYRPLNEVASSKLARKTHVDMLTKVQINYYAAGLHRAGSDAVFRYTSLELADRFALLNAAFGESDYRVDKELRIITKTNDAGQS